ncbi:MAG: hypothetical protein AAGA48_18510 [Myxococcota bacterium]
MKTSTPLSFGLAAILASGLYAAPWALMWILDLAPPDFEVETRPSSSDAVFIPISMDALDDLEDVEGELIEEEEEAVEEPVAEAPPEPTPEATGTAKGTDEGSGGDDAAVEGKGTATLAKGGKAGAAKPRPRARRRRRPAKCQLPHPHIRKGDDGIMEIDRSFVRAMTKNLKTFMSLGYSRPYREDGVKGWYISGFGCASPVFKAGFRRKDVLLTVNGKNTRTVTGVFLLYMKLKKQSDFEVRLLRRGKRRTLKFRVVPS